MQALMVEALSGDLSGTRLLDVAAPARGEGQVLVRVRATSLNFPDLLMTRGEYQLKPALPFVPGLEIAGDIVETGAVTGFKVGDRVFGGTRTGGMAELASIDPSALQKIPDDMDYPTAAALGAAYGTAYTGLVELGGLRAGQWILVHGASGGVGLAAADLGRALGARVIVTSGSADKLDMLRRLCQPEALLLAEGRFRDQVAEMTGGRLADLVYDPVGGDIFDESTRCVAFGGKLLIIGFAGGRIPEVPVNIPLIKGFSIVGVRAGEYARRFPDRGRKIREDVLALAAEGRLKPHLDRVLPLSRWREAFEAMAERRVIGKIVLEPGC